MQSGHDNRHNFMNAADFNIPIITTTVRQQLSFKIAKAQNEVAAP